VSAVKAAVVIPARLASSRLPGKVLADIAGHPMLWHVYHRCCQASRPASIHIATDAEAVADQVRSWGGQVWMTDPDCASGTERIVSILPQLDADVIVNVQGDEPRVDPAVIDQVIAAFESVTPQPDIVTPAYRLDGDRIFNTNKVKLVRRHDGYALYFSRSPIPHVRDVEPNEWSTATHYWGHIGIYGYRRQVLEQYGSMPPSPLEQAEKLEQLRFMEAGRSIYTFETDYHSTPVDTPADLELVRSLFAKS
jgi:3-deoxy-manno-octulosonate cytidylyltransferase (CMP-KDO synthetase)